MSKQPTRRKRVCLPDISEPAASLDGIEDYLTRDDCEARS